jgi:hypothetical protein
MAAAMPRAAIERGRRRMRKALGTEGQDNGGVYASYLLARLVAAQNNLLILWVKNI